MNRKSHPTQGIHANASREARFSSFLPPLVAKLGPWLQLCSPHNSEKETPVHLNARSQDRAVATSVRFPPNYSFRCVATCEQKHQCYKEKVKGFLSYERALSGKNFFKKASYQKQTACVTPAQK